MSEVVLGGLAEEDLLEVWDYFAGKDPAAADRQLDRIERTLQMLALHPLAGPSRDDLIRGLRFYPVDNYLVFYRPDDRGIVVARVLHGSRDYRQEFV